ncbi:MULTISPECIES: AAA family ATPase [Rhizobium]|uniref:MoxR family ATPase n=1 Tax=Rhizobium tropici TaxID=398 RepID=A0A6P1C6D4_RHITR|nr:MULTISPECIES: MoxR family ATPase [Rhizobium]AGB74202.1 ATPase associated with various cellular activities [Rhizobium tropici CIAT 899]MBB4240687.1 MoxR-like ATPase [Rhizobium tropici]MBB5591896.1 MoxR-like ATPase [Rhizobium tropici]MBB6490950.1 MoxR-like ATPase [Rhizobium tropici]NEV12608.1 MoxR family ATPase [Rhizobium tropici]
MDLGEFRNLVATVRGEIAKAVQGQDALIDLVLISIFARGHCLVEGPPGTAKTLLARSVSAVMDLEYRRIQFTPDLMPGDVLGINLFNFQTNQFHLTKGPVFTDILLADEINRAPPKTQSALLQAMNERIVTIDGTDYSLGPDFFVLATQNPIEQQGTYPLPEAQLDRFLFKLVVDFPDRNTEIAILAKHAGQALNTDVRNAGIQPLVSSAILAEGRRLIDGIHLDSTILTYVVDLVRATRSDPDILHGASTRAADALASAVRVRAAFEGRDYGLPDDVQALLVPALRHRIVLSPAAEIDGRTADDVLRNIKNRVDAPR